MEQVRKIFRGEQFHLKVDSSADIVKLLEQFATSNQQWKKYEPIGFQDNVLKLLKEAEKLGLSCDCQNLYEIAGVVLLNQHVNRCEKGYRLHFPNIDACPCCVVTSENALNQLKFGTTGLFSWPATYSFIENWHSVFLDGREGETTLLEKLRDKTVLEVGCGVGLLGICSMLFADVTKYIFTDCSEQVLQLVQENIELNFSDKDLDCEKHNRVQSAFEVKLLDFCQSKWDKDDELTIAESDVLIGCDIVFDPNMVKPLCRFIASFLGSESRDNKETKKMCYIVSTVRNEDTYNLFLETLTLHQINSETVDLRSSRLDASLIKLCTLFL